MDFFTIYDIFFRRHYVFFVLDHECRKIRHFAVTTQPNAARVLQQLREAFPYDSGQGRRLICDSDPLFSRNVLNFITGVGIKVYQFRGQAWMNGHAERFVLSARQDIFNHVIVLNAKHIRRLTTAYVSCDHDDRTHIALGKTSPANQDVEKPGPGAELIAQQRLRGLHHRYRWIVRNAAYLPWTWGPKGGGDCLHGEVRLKLWIPPARPRLAGASRAEDSRCAQDEVQIGFGSALTVGDLAMRRDSASVGRR